MEWTQPHVWSPLLPERNIATDHIHNTRSSLDFVEDFSGNMIQHQVPSCALRFPQGEDVMKNIYPERDRLNSKTESLLLSQQNQRLCDVCYVAARYCILSSHINQLWEFPALHSTPGQLESPFAGRDSLFFALHAWLHVMLAFAYFGDDSCLLTHAFEPPDGCFEWLSVPDIDTDHSSTPRFGKKHWHCGVSWDTPLLLYHIIL